MVGREPSRGLRAWAAVMLLVVGACSKPGPPPPAPPRGPVEKIVLGDASGNPYLTFWREPERVRMEAAAPGEPLRVTGLDIGRERRYQDPRVPLLRARDHKSGEIYLLDALGNAVWRVQITPSRVRISRADRTGEAYFLPRNREGQVLARHGAKRYGSVSPGRSGQQWKVRREDGTYLADAPIQLSPFALAALLLEDLPPEHRLIVFAELLKTR